MAPTKVRQTIPGRRLLGTSRQPEIIGKRHSPSRTDPYLALFADFTGRLYRCKFQFDQRSLNYKLRFFLHAQVDQGSRASKLPSLLN